MLKLAELKKKRAAKVDALAAMFRSEQDETRSLTTDEQTALDQGETEIRSLDQQIRVAELMAEAERRAEGGEVLSGSGAMDLRSFNVARAVRGAMTGRLDGLEGEYHAEASRGRETRGVMIPTQVLLGEARSQTVAPATAGGHTVATQLQALADRNRPSLRVEGLGATVLSGLTGFVDLPNLVSSGQTSWVAENGDATRTAATFGKVAMAPKTVTGEYQLSRRLILQSNESIENVLRRDLGLLLAQALDKAAINGSGAIQPVGILSNTGVDKVATQAAFSDTVADMIAELEMDDWAGTAAFLSSPKVAKLVRKIKDSQGRIIPEAEIFHNVRHEFTTQVPDDLGDDDDKSALIYGLWSELYIGYWSAVDLLVNPYHADVASNGGVLLHAFLDADVALRHPKAFKYAEI